MEKEDIDIAPLSETWFKPSVYVNFNGFNTHRQDRADVKGGVAILLKNCINIHQTTIKNLYRGIDNFFRSLNTSFILGGDFNAHHIAWGCETGDICGKTLLEALSRTNLIYLYNGASTYINHNKKSAIDLTILCSRQVQNLLEWHTLSDTFGSDHVPITVECKLASLKIVFRTRRRWNVKKENWDIYHTENYNRLSTENISTYDNFINSINQSAETSIPTIKNSKYLYETWKTLVDG
nr:unnamed protein product [Callosobruchus chinensis]